VKTDISFLGTTPIERLKTLMNKLRTACPWDAEQTFESIAPYTIEEAYEVSEAIDRKDMTSLREELGDLLFQVIFQTKISSESAGFDFDDVCDDLTRKMVDRHPHVFQFTDDRTAQEQTVSGQISTGFWKKSLKKPRKWLMQQKAKMLTPLKMKSVTYFLP